ncbi:MAG: multicopper oxidase domain-containing protein [Alphaproteobacteria bacterium]|nr:multicopper oxidase domain-containing protein [Alphaproteobacteria bacterium]
MISYLRRALAVVLLSASPAFAGTYDLVIDRTAVRIDGQERRVFSINGQFAGPTLRWKEGEEVTINVTNRLTEDTSIHWHGILLPFYMDGVPMVSFAGIKPGETFTYRFRVRQAGTYWYHSHSSGQEQEGMYAPIVVEPTKGERYKVDRDYVVMLSDQHAMSAGAILRKLKQEPGYFNDRRRTLPGLIRDLAKAKSPEERQRIIRDRLDWGDMRMDPTDLADVTGYTFLVNGRGPSDNWTGLFTMFAVCLFVFSYGVGGEYPLASASAAERAEAARLSGPIPEMRPPSLLTMADMGMNHAAMAGMDHSKMDHSAMAMPTDNADGLVHAPPVNASPGERVLGYRDLRRLDRTYPLKSPDRTIELRLTGNMDKFFWSFDDRKYSESPTIDFVEDETVRLVLKNETMMNHPIHLHGIFMDLDNGAGDDRPRKHVVIVPPGRSVAVTIQMTEVGRWPFHCHLMFHMMTGMFREFVVHPRGAPLPVTTAPHSEGGSHVHKH